MPLLPYQYFLHTSLHEPDVVWVHESCRFTAASSQSVMSWTCTEEMRESHHDCFPCTLALREEGECHALTELYGMYCSPDMMKGMLWWRMQSGYQLLHHVPRLPWFVSGNGIPDKPACVPLKLPHLCSFLAILPKCVQILPRNCSTLIFCSIQWHP